MLREKELFIYNPNNDYYRSLYSSGKIREEMISFAH